MKKVVAYLRSFGLFFMTLADKLENKKHQGGHIFLVDRSVPFNPAEFISSGWSVVQESKTSLAMDRVDLDQVSFETCLKPGETHITGKEKLRRHVSAGHILADAKIGQAFLEQEGREALEYFYQERGITRFELLGTIIHDLHNPSGNHSALCLCRSGGGQWIWYCLWLDHARDSSHPSLVLQVLSL